MNIKRLSCIIVMMNIVTLLFSKPIRIIGLEMPYCDYYEENDDHQVRKFANYTICYRESYEQPEWSAYYLDSSYLIKNVKRSNTFKTDPDIITKTSTPLDYVNSGFDRGHLTPAADMAFGEKAMSDTFYMSNICPQSPGLNRFVWKYLEKQIRDWCDKFETIYIVSGPVLNKPSNEYNHIGTNNVSVPEYFYKTVLAVDRYDHVGAIAFIMPNEKCDDDFWKYAKTIDELEEITGLDFYYRLDDYTEDYIESSINIDFWK